MTSTSLKILAAILMSIDHIGEFIPGMPIYLRWIGRLSAPIFFIAVHWQCIMQKTEKNIY
ncbi:TraX family protein [Lacrimispora sp.]|uniref:TraX family protein n=1 Tax=Lacrimispora sp. TaxID=2719234 RepID=UPI003FA5B92B